MASQAAVVAIDPANFVANAGQITFSEAGFGTANPTNPVYTAGQYGGSGSAPGVSFGSFFTGQLAAAAAAATGGCPVGVVSGCVVGLPAGPLQLDTDLLGATIRVDEAHGAGEVVLGGDPFGLGSIAMLFTIDQAAVSFDAGFFNAVGTTRVTAYGRDGSVLGSLLNSVGGIESLFLGSDDGTAQIAGLLISLVAPEEAGFTIDNVRFGTVSTTGNGGNGGGTTDPPPTNPPPTNPPPTNPPPAGEVPEPATLALVGLGLVGLGLFRRRRTA